MISQIFASVCAFIWTILMVRYLGVAKYGIMGFAISLTGILNVINEFGITAYMVRHIATDYDSTPKFLGNAFPIKSFFSFVTFLITLIILIIIKAPELTITVTLLLTLEMIIKSFTGLLNGTFQAYEQTKYQGIGTAIQHLLLLIFILICIYTDFGIIGISISYIISNFIAFIYEYFILRKYITKPKFELDLTFSKKIILSSLPFAVTGLLYTIYYSIDVVMLTQLVGDYATGIYNATYKLISVLTLFYSIYIAVVFPVMSKLFEKDKKMLLISFEKSIKYLMLIIIPLAISTVIYSKDIILLFYGQEYFPAASVLSILIWTVCLLFISGACNTLLNASHKEVTITKIYTIAALFNIILNLFMIPYLSYDGAAITTVLSDILIVIIQLYVIYRLGHRPDKKLYYDLLKIIAGSAILGIALYFLKLNMWVAIPVGIIIYFATIYFLKVFDDDDEYMIKKILGKNWGA